MLMSIGSVNERAVGYNSRTVLQRRRCVGRNQDTCEMTRHSRGTHTTAT